MRWYEEYAFLIAVGLFALVLIAAVLIGLYLPGVRQ
jgi:hypothetical protein